jgi:hypothetical protein
MGIESNRPVLFREPSVAAALEVSNATSPCYRRGTALAIALTNRRRTDAKPTSEASLVQRMLY